MAGSDRGACRLGCREKEVAEKTSFEKEARIYLRILKKVATFALR